MPTGYTCIIEDDDGCTFEEYVWRCARGMGACIMMRDDGLDVPVTDDAVSGRSSYYAESLRKSKAKLAELEGMTPLQAEPMAEADYQGAIASRDGYVKKNAEEARRYREMRAAVEKWKPPTTDHDGLKAFMLQQISTSTEYAGYVPGEPIRLSGADWLAERIATTKRDIASTEEHMAKDAGRSAERIAWVQALRESVPQPAPKKT